jgi:hypothetical protein
MSHQKSLFDKKKKKKHFLFKKDSLKTGLEVELLNFTTYDSLICNVVNKLFWCIFLL